MTDGNEHFFVPTTANTGLRGKNPTGDGGVGDVTLRAADLGSFKSPSLRNVDVTAPYGHDGRFATLDALIDHYSDNAIFDPNLGYQIPVGPLKFTASEKAAMIAFLKTLTDRTSLTDPRFSNPFVARKDIVAGVTHTVRATGAMLRGVGAAAAEAPAVLGSAVLVTEIPPVPPAPPAPRARSPHAVIERLVSFDGNKDNRISREELPERMQGLIARGDRNGDAALDSNEILALVNVASSERRHVSFLSQASEGLLGVVKDLRLSPEKHASALALVNAGKLPHKDHLASIDVYREMRALLDGEEYENFVAAAVRLSRSPQFRRGAVSGIIIQ
jgi:hypothetical protein